MEPKEGMVEISDLWLVGLNNMDLRWIGICSEGGAGRGDWPLSPGDVAYLQAGSVKTELNEGHLAGVTELFGGCVGEVIHLVTRILWVECYNWVEKNRCSSLQYLNYCALHMERRDKMTIKRTTFKLFQYRILFNSWGKSREKLQ